MASIKSSEESMELDKPYLLQAFRLFHRSLQSIEGRLRSSRRFIYETGPSLPDRNITLWKGVTYRPRAYPQKE